VATIATLALGSTGAALYAVAERTMREEDDMSLRRLSESAAASVEQFIAQAVNAMDQYALDPHVAAALESRDTVRIMEAEDRLTRTVPGAALVRLLPDSVEVPDEQRSPRMGFADLDVVRQSRTARPLPSVHVANTTDVHIALARRLAEAEGTILASLSPGAAFSALPREVGRGAIDLRQDDLSLASSGDSSLRLGPPNGSIPVQGTSWKVHYWVAPRPPLGPLWFAVIPAIGALLTALAALYVYRWSAAALNRDSEAIARLVHDLVSGKAVRRPGVRLKNLQKLVAQLAASRTSTLETPAAPAKPVAPEVTTETVDLEGPLEAVLKPVEPIATVTPVEVPEISTVEISADIFQPFEIRGVVGDTVNAEVIRILGAAIGSQAQELGQTTVTIARDGRASSPQLADALTSGLAETGCDVVNIGLAPITVLYYAGEILDTGSAVLVTGGHEPPDTNGLKIILAGERLADRDIWKLRDRIKNEDFRRGHGEVQTRDLTEAYIERIASDTQVGRPMKVVVDCGNGLTGEVAPALYREIGCEVVPLFCDMAPGFPNHPPDPAVRKNLEALIAAVKEHKADLGVALDADGDRLAVVDSSGLPIRPDRLLMLFAADVLSREPGSDIIFDVRSTRHLASHIVRHGGRPLMWKPDRTLMRAKIRETGALLGGDMNGRFYFSERWYGFDDGLYAAARLLEILSLDPRRSSEIFRELPDSVVTPELIVHLAKGEPARVIARALELADFPEGRLSDIDGLRVDFADGFGLVRPSPTEPALCLQFEADSPEALSRVMRDFKSLLKKAKPNIIFPTLSKPG
jgi:phosphomannomutase/phosphoglucomutase